MLDNSLCMETIQLSLLTSMLSYASFKIILFVFLIFNQYLKIRNFLLIYKGNLPSSQYTKLFVVFFIDPKNSLTKIEMYLFYIGCFVETPNFTGIRKNTMNIRIKYRTLSFNIKRIIFHSV